MDRTAVISSFWLHDSFFSPADKRRQNPVRARLTRAAGRQTVPRRNSKSSCSLFLLWERRGVSATPSVPRKGTFSPGDWRPSVHAARGHQVLKDLSVGGAAHRRLPLCAARGVVKPPAGSSISPYLLGHGRLGEISRGPFKRSSARVFGALRFASCVRLSRHS